MESTQDLILSLVEDAKAGLSLTGRLPQLSCAKSPRKHGPGSLGGGPPLSPSKTSKAHASPKLRRQESSETSKTSSSVTQIPRFYFPNGKPASQDALLETRDKIDTIFSQQKDPLIRNHVHLRPLLQEVVELPSFFSLPLFRKLKLKAVEKAGKGEGEDLVTGVISKECFNTYWETCLINRDHLGRAFEILRDEAKENTRKHITKDSLSVLVECIVHTHPGLEFLVQTPEFQDRYLETVVYRTFHQVNLSDTGKISSREFRKSNLLDVLCELDEENDVNVVRQYFSYEHFYVIYCKFWELDSDHDFLINKDDLLRYGQHALTCRIVDRIFSEAPRKFVSQVPGYMCYEDFVRFILNEEDKMNEPSINYWFRCLDLDGNMVLVSHELEHFYSEQAQRIECLNQEPVSFEDILTQLTDMLHPEIPGVFTIKDFRRNPRHASNLFNVMFNLKKFFSFETKDPREARNAGLCDWDRFAQEEYLRLSLEEEMAEAAEEGGFDEFTEFSL